MPEAATDAATDAAVDAAADVAGGAGYTSPYAGLAVQPIAAWENERSVTHGGGTATAWSPQIGAGTLAGGTGITYADGDNYAMQPNGSQHILNTTDAALRTPFEGGSGDWTVAWVAKTASELQAIASICDTAGGNNWWYVGYGTARIIRLAQFDGAFSQVQSVAAPASGAAHYAVCRFNAAGNSGSVRLNGGSEVSGSMTRSPAGLDNFVLGARVTTSAALHFTGQVRDLLVFNQRLTGADLTALETVLAGRTV